MASKRSNPFITSGMKRISDFLKSSAHEGPILMGGRSQKMNRLPFPAKRVLRALVGLAGKIDFACPTLHDIETMTGLRRRTVQRAVSTLSRLACSQLRHDLPRTVPSSPIGMTLRSLHQTLQSESQFVITNHLRSFL